MNTNLVVCDHITESKCTRCGKPLQPCKCGGGFVAAITLNAEGFESAYLCTMCFFRVFDVIPRQKKGEKKA